MYLRTNKNTAQYCCCSFCCCCCFFPLSLAADNAGNLLTDQTTHFNAVYEHRIVLKTTALEILAHIAPNVNVSDSVCVCVCVCVCVHVCAVFPFFDCLSPPLSLALCLLAQLSMFEDGGNFVSKYLLVAIMSPDRHEVIHGLMCMGRLANLSANHAWLHKLGTERECVYMCVRE
jgi:hypothetical protein